MLPILKYGIYGIYGIKLCGYQAMGASLMPKAGVGAFYGFALISHARTVLHTRTHTHEVTPNVRIRQYQDSEPGIALVRKMEKQ